MTPKITPEALAAFMARDRQGLHRELGLRAWHVSPLDTSGTTPPRWMHPTLVPQWTAAAALRVALANEVAANGK